MTLRLDDISINTIVGDGSFVKGCLRVNGSVRVDGDIDGDLSTDGNVNVGENGRIRGDINAASVTIGGIIVGNIYAADSITLLKTAVVVGDVIAHHVTIEENVILHGRCISISDNERFQHESEMYLQAQTIVKKAERL